MAFTYEWKLTGLKRQDTADLNNLVVGTRWELKGTDTDGNEGKFSGATPLDLPDADEDNFIAYSDLTEVQILGWVKGIVSGSGPGNYMDHINEQIQKQIDETRYTSLEVQENDLPWSETSGSNVTPEAAQLDADAPE
jgi:hypothetical protein|tara:strand:+ start:932 stop:1342 length:411 start_codon:yes stop_codon:yes gene_type:complete